MELINKNIRVLREMRGWNQQQLAEKLGIKKSMVGAYEEFRSVPLLKVVEKMAEVFEIDLNTLIKKDLSKPSNAMSLVNNKAR